MKDRIKINEIFYSIQGESSLVGWPTVFVRTSGCPLRCVYCDTKYSYYEGSFMSLNEVLEKIESFQTPYVCVTGGEPLIQAGSFELMRILCERGYTVSCETSGAKNCLNLDPRVRVILDVKTPSSGEVESFDFENLKLDPRRAEIKFVIGSQEDFTWCESFCREHGLFEKFLVFYSPSFEDLSGKALAEFILGANSRARMQLQLHKFIWAPDQRGV